MQRVVSTSSYTSQPWPGTPRFVAHPGATAPCPGVVHVGRELSPGRPPVVAPRRAVSPVAVHSLVPSTSPMLISQVVRSHPRSVSPTVAPSAPGQQLSPRTPRLQPLSTQLGLPSPRALSPGLPFAIEMGRCPSPRPSVVIRTVAPRGVSPGAIRSTVMTPRPVPEAKAATPNRGEVRPSPKPCVVRTSRPTHPAHPTHPTHPVTKAPQVKRQASRGKGSTPSVAPPGGKAASDDQTSAGQRLSKICGKIYSFYVFLFKFCSSAVGRYCKMYTFAADRKSVV